MKVGHGHENQAYRSVSHVTYEKPKSWQRPYNNAQILFDFALRGGRHRCQNGKVPLYRRFVGKAMRIPRFSEEEYRDKRPGSGSPVKTE